MKTKTNIWKVGLYNQKHAFVHEYGKELIQLLDPKENEHILDLGCGSGQLTNEIGKSGAQVIGMDSSFEMISDAKNRYPDLGFFIKDADTKAETGSWGDMRHFLRETILTVSS